MMEVQTRALIEGEEALRRANIEIRRICDEIDSTARAVGSMKSLNVPRHKLNIISNDLMGLSMSLSQMSCFLEMANETYVRTEKQITNARFFYLLRRANVAWKFNGPELTNFKKMEAPGINWGLKEIFESIESD